jgi:predicted DNA-binding transcriptional regulator AlpA
VEQATETTDSDYVVKTSKAAERIGVSLRTLQRMRARGEAPPRVKISDRIFGYRNSVLNQFLASRTEA